jgi:hypothetical protein
LQEKGESMNDKDREKMEYRAASNDIYVSIQRIIGRMQGTPNREPRDHDEVADLQAFAENLRTITDMLLHDDSRKPKPIN